MDVEMMMMMIRENQLKQSKRMMKIVLHRSTLENIGQKESAYELGVEQEKILASPAVDKPQPPVEIQNCIHRSGRMQ